MARLLATSCLIDREAIVCDTNETARGRCHAGVNSTRPGWSSDLYGGLIGGTRVDATVAVSRQCLRAGQPGREHKEGPGTARSLSKRSNRKQLTTTAQVTPRSPNPDFRRNPSCLIWCRLLGGGKQRTRRFNWRCNSRDIDLAACGNVSASAGRAGALARWPSHDVQAFEHAQAPDQFRSGMAAEVRANSGPEGRERAQGCFSLGCPFWVKPVDE